MNERISGYSFNSQRSSSRPLFRQMKQKEIIGNDQYSFRIDYNSGEIGSGFRGNVYGCYRIQDTQQRKYAVKIMQLSTDEILEAAQQLEVTQKIVGQYICQVQFAARTSDTLYIVTEFCEQGTLTQYFKRNRPNYLRCIEIFQQICQGYYDSLYKKKIIHRDLKPDTILMSNNIPKISGFTFGKQLDNNVIPIEQTYKCTPSFGAPQILVDKCVYSYKCDIYSLGVILYQLLNDLKTINGISNMFQLNSFLIKSKETPLEQLIQFQNQDIPESLKNLIYATLMYREEDRISIEELLNDLKIIIEELSLQPLKQTIPQHFTY